MCRRVDPCRGGPRILGTGGAWLASHTTADRYDCYARRTDGIENGFLRVSRIILLLCLFAGLIGGCVVGAAGEPYVPASDDEVLETLPRLVLSERGELNVKRRQLRADPGNEALAAEVAAGYVDLGKRTGDPRYDGYARAALRRWWDADDAPANVLQLRAKIKERDHDYDAAVDDLRLLLEHEPLNVQAWIEVANLRRVQGRYDEAREACDALDGFAAEVPAAIARVPLSAVTGGAQEAYDRLEAIKPEVSSRWTGTLPWLLAMQAEVARALGHDERAEAHYREAFEVDPGDMYLLRVYGDFLLDHGRADDALPMLRDHVSDTGILLRAAIAAKQAGDTGLAEEWSGQLENRFEEIRLRGGVPHGRFESRFYLELKGEPQRALVVALENWDKQKEYRDHRNALEAALAAGDPEAAAPVIAFLKQQGTKDVVLEALVERLVGS